MNFIGDSFRREAVPGFVYKGEPLTGIVRGFSGY